MARKRIYPRIKDLIRIFIHRTILAGEASVEVGPYTIRLKHEEFQGQEYLQLFVNNFRQPKSWRLSTKPLRGKLKYGYIPIDRDEQYYVIGNDGRQYSHLFINPQTFDIGTRMDFGAKYACECLSAKDRIFNRELKAIRKAEAERRSSGVAVCPERHAPALLAA
jgi:hypothetical protein